MVKKKPCFIILLPLQVCGTDIFMVIYRAMQSQSGKEEFLNQFRSIVDGVRHNRLKIDKQVSQEKHKRDNLAGTLQVSSGRSQKSVQLLIYSFQNLLELQRAYATAIRQLSLECKNYETLLARKRRDV